MTKLIYTILALMLFCISGQGQVDADDIARLQSVGSVLMTPDGRHIVYTVSVPADPKVENKAPSTHLYLWDLKTSSSKLLLDQGRFWRIRLRPEHQSISFLSRMEGDKHTSLYELLLKGGKAKKLYEFEQSIREYEWSPDGQKIVFTAKEKHNKPKTSLPYEPEIYEFDLKNHRAYVVTPGFDDLIPIQIDGNLSSVQWSPNGKYISMMRAPTPLVDDFYMAQSYKIVDAVTGQLVRSIQHEGKKGMLSWSPDSKQVAFIAGADLHDPIEGRIFVAKVSDGKAKNIKPKFGGKFDEVYWLDKNKLLFLASESAWSSIGTMKANGKKLKRIVEPGGPVVQHISINKDGNMALRVHSPMHPSELYLLERGADQPKRLTHSNPWLEDRRLAKQELIRYKASDGLEIHGVLVHPLDKKDGMRYPLIVSVHGGPESHVDNGWVTAYSLAGQMGATKGYYVFYPNYRGSTGRGLKYTLKSQGKPAEKEFDDIVDGVDYLVKQGWVDRDKVGVTGGSYGGYATGWMATKYSDRFAAGVMFVGISNKVSKWGTTDIPKEEFLVHSRKWIWEDYMYYLKRSPIYYADKCKTPLLIMHGADDPRVHPSQSMELYRHVKVRTDTPVKLVFYPGEGHGNRKSTARYDYSLRMMRWFDKYLKGAAVDTDAPLLPKE